MVEAFRYLHFVMFIGGASVLPTAALVCPYSERICSCFDDSIVCDQIREIPPLKIGRNISDIPAISFGGGGNISSISNSSLPSGLRVMEFIHHPLTSISDDAFDSSASTLNELYFIGAKFRQLPKAFLKLNNLTILQISHTQIETWDLSILQHLATTITDLYLKNVSLYTWPSWISNFHLLQAVDLSRNNLSSTIPDDAFNFVNDTLKYLNLAHTGLSEIPQALPTLVNLSSLTLSGNNFTDVNTVTELALCPFGPNLLYLYAESIGLNSILNFSSFTSLREINLNDNNISDSISGSFPPTVTLLSIRGNQLSLVPLQISSLNELTHLYLSHNQITEIGQDTFPRSLKCLDLCHNKLSVITNTAFRNLTFLRKLYLNNNPIAKISALAFSDLLSVEILHLDSTHLVEVPVALTPLKNQSRIDLHHIPTLICACPVSPELTTWVALPGVSVRGRCNNKQLIDRYLRTACVTRQTYFVHATTTATTIANIPPSGDAHEPRYSLCLHMTSYLCGYLLSLFLLSIR